MAGVEKIRSELDANGFSHLDIEVYDTGISLRYDTDDNTAKQNYADGLIDIDDIRACLLPLGLDARMSEMTDHDTILYELIKESDQ